ncbi:MAG: hypothetical protein ACOYKN_10805 [Pirellula sp.]
MRLLRPKNAQPRRLSARRFWAQTLVWTCLSIPGLGFESLSHRVYGQEAAAPTHRTKNVDASVCNDAKLKEKNEKLKPESFDIATIEAYYQNCLFARIAQPNAESMNKARIEILGDIDVMERRVKQNPEMLAEYNKMLMRQIKEILSKDNEGKTYHPSARVLAAVLAGRINRVPASTSAGGQGDPAATKLLIDLLDPKEAENDGMIATSLSYLPRHWSYPGLDATGLDRAQGQFMTNVQAFLASQKPAARGKKEDDYLRELMIENLTLIASGKGEAAKQANAMLAGIVLPVLKDPKKHTEWLAEKAMWSFGQVKLADLKPEDISTIEKGSLEFVKTSLDAWTKRCDQTQAASPGGFGGMGSGPGGPPGLSGPGSEGESGPGAGPAGGPGGGPAGPPGFNNPAKPKNPFEDQPREVKNARRFLQQRLERVHYGLTGTGRKSATATPPAESKGLMSVVDDAAKLKLMDVVKKVEALQDALNKESITSIDLVKNSSRRPIFDLKQAIAAIIGDDGSKKEAPPEEGKDPLDDGFGGAGGN